MADNELALTCNRGDNFYLDFHLDSSGIDYTGYVVQFVVEEEYGLGPVIDISSDDIGQTAITLTSTAGLECSITLTPTQTKFKFSLGKYAVRLLSPTGVKETMLVGDWHVEPVAGE